MYLDLNDAQIVKGEGYVTDSADGYSISGTALKIMSYSDMNSQCQMPMESDLGL